MKRSFNVQGQCCMAAGWATSVMPASGMGVLFRFAATWLLIQPLLMHSWCLEWNGPKCLDLCHLWMRPGWSPISVKGGRTSATPTKLAVIFVFPSTCQLPELQLSITFTSLWWARNLCVCLILLKASPPFPLLRRLSLFATQKWGTVIKSAIYPKRGRVSGDCVWRR